MPSNKNNNFIAIDFETANTRRDSICEVGICVVRGGEIAETRSWLVRPEDNLYQYWNIRCHGIRPEDTSPGRRRCRDVCKVVAKGDG